MKDPEVIIIGAGISGLVVTRELSKAGKRVMVLEARDRSGGRIHTTGENDFPAAAETGAEFIHGKLPLTIKLLKQYGIKFSMVKGEIWQLKNHVFTKDADFINEHSGLLKEKLKALDTDLPVQKFLEESFPGEEFLSLYRSVKKFVEGYDTGDISRASTFEFRKEWAEAEDWKQYRVDGGYSRLTDALWNDCKTNGCVFHLGTEVKSISWKKDEAEISCSDGRSFVAGKIVLTVPLGVLQSGAIKFSPSLPEKEAAFTQLGFGDIIKILLLFNESFWKKKETRERTGHDLKKLFFLNSDASVPTWWTQYPSEVPLLTGWLSGSAAKERMDLHEEKILQEAIASLALIFKASEEYLKNNLSAWKIMNWNKDVFAHGSYTYATVDAEKQVETAGKPVEHTLFFAGEAFSPESGYGLVEAAVNSGLKTAKLVLSAW
jgi:monoamine oxidase